MHPFEPDKEYPLGRLRSAAEEILQTRQSDQILSAKMRVQIRKDIPWAKSWNEELYPLKILTDHLKLPDDAIFRWTPNRAADFELRETAGKVVKLQSTMAYAEREGSVGKQGGHVRKLEMIKLNADGFSFGGGFVSEPRARSPDDDVKAWRVGIVRALRRKLKPEHTGCWLLIFASRCQFETIDFDFSQVVTPAIEQVGRTAWEQVFDGLYVLDEPPSAFAEFHHSRLAQESLEHDRRRSYGDNS